VQRFVHWGMQRNTPHGHELRPHGLVKRREAGARGKASTSRSSSGCARPVDMTRSRSQGICCGNSDASKRRVRDALENGQSWALALRHAESAAAIPRKPQIGRPTVKVLFLLSLRLSAHGALWRRVPLTGCSPPRNAGGDFTRAKKLAKGPEHRM